MKPKLIFVQKKSETECKNVFTFFFKVFQEKNMFGEFHFHVEKLFFSCFFGGDGVGGTFSEEKNNVTSDIKFEKYRLINFTLKNTHFLTSWYVVPVGSVDDVVVPEEVFVVAGPPVWVGHHLVE